MQILVTDKSGLGKTSHRHIVLLDENSGQGFATYAGPKKEKHTHELQFIAPQVDPVSGQPISEGQWIVMPGEDGHLHETLEEYPTQIKVKEESDEDIVADVLCLFKEARDCDKSSRDKANEAENFVKGVQWEPTTEAFLKESKRACLTINLVGKAVDTLLGLQMQQRTDLQYLPQEGGDAVVSDVYTYIAKHILDQCDFHRHESKTFKRAVVRGRGDYEITVEFDNSLEGDICVRSVNPLDVSYGPHEDESAQDCEYLFKERIYSKAKIQQLWPDKADEIDKDFDIFSSFGEDRPHHSRPGDAYNQFAYQAAMGDAVMVDIARKEYRVLECHRKIYQRKYFLVSPSGFVHDAQGWKKEDVDAAVADLGLFAIERLVSYIRITKVAGNVVLADENPADIPGEMFYVIPLYCYKDGNDYYGKVEAVKDPQREVNKRHSQITDIINKMVAYNWFTDETTFPNTTEEEKFRKTSSTPGAVFKVNNVDRTPKMSEGVKFPNEVAGLLQMNEAKVDEIMNVVVQPSGANESGSHLMHRKDQALAGNEFLFDNLSYAKKQIGKALIPLIQRYWSPERAYRLLMNQAENQDQQVDIQGIPIQEWPEEEIIRALQDADTGKLDVVVSETEASPSMRFSTWMVLSEAAQSGMQIPPELLLEYLPGVSAATRKKLEASLLASQQAASQEADTEAQAEVQKTLIAQGIIPPDVAEQYGIAPSTTPMDQGATDPAAEQQLPPDITGQSFPNTREEIYDITDKPDGTGKIIRVISQ